MVYSKEYLIEKLQWMLDKYGVIQTKLIDKEPGFPNRKAYIREFGSVAKACEAIGYCKYQKNKFDIHEAQKTLDQRNGNFDLLSFNGMGKKNLTKCRTCGYTWNTVTDNLLRNNTSSHGCPQCNNKSFLDKLHANNLQLVKHLGGTQYRVECTQCHTEFEGRSGNLSDPKFICQYCPPDKKYHKINQNKDLYRESTVSFSDFILHLEKTINEESLMWFYCLGLLFADGHFDNKTSRVTLTLHEKDHETMDSISNFLNCKPFKEQGCVKISFCGNYVVQDLISKYSISNTKTYNPCNLTSITDDKMIAFIIGFIDGDGCIRKRTDSDLCIISIKLHKSWKDNLELMATCLYDFFHINKIPHAVTIKSKDKEYIQINFGNSTVLNGLIDFIQNNNLPVMERKWDKIRLSKKYKLNNQYKEVM